MCSKDLQVSGEVIKHFEVLKEDGKVISYSNKTAEELASFLDYIEHPYHSEDCGGHPTAPEMWRFFKK